MTDEQKNQIAYAKGAVIVEYRKMNGWGEFWPSLYKYAKVFATSEVHINANSHEAITTVPAEIRTGKFFHTTMVADARMVVRSDKAKPLAAGDVLAWAL